MSAEPATLGPFDPADVLVGFARTLRAAGVAAGPDRVHATVLALDLLDPSSRRDLYWAGRVTLCSSAEDLTRYDRVFAAYFAGAGLPDGGRPAPGPTMPAPASLDGDDRAGSRQDGRPPRQVPALASAVEVLRHRDLATVSPDDRLAVRALLAALSLRGAPRRVSRTVPSGRGAVDARRTVRRLLQSGGEPALVARHRRTQRPRRVVLLVDVSGSMGPYADALLRFAHAAGRTRRGFTRTQVEVFTLGTRLTRVTRHLAHRDPELALREIAAEVPDWSGGTRLGEQVRRFLDLWGQRGMARGAVVVLLSDGWERGDPALLGEQMSRLHRLAHRVVWANPRAGQQGYAPQAGGMAAALPHVDAFVAGHSVAALAQLATLVSAARPAARPERDAARA